MESILDRVGLSHVIFYLRLFHRLAECGGARLLRWQRSGKLSGPDDFRSAGDAMAAAASSAARDALDRTGGSCYSDAQRSLVGGGAGRRIVVFGGDEFSVVDSQCVHASGSANGPLVRNSLF